MGKRAHMGGLLKHGQRPHQPRRMSTDINTRIIDPNLNPTLDLCAPLFPRKRRQRNRAPPPRIALKPKRDPTTEGGERGRSTHVRGRRPTDHHPPEDPTITTTGGNKYNDAKYNTPLRQYPPYLKNTRPHCHNTSAPIIFATPGGRQ